MRALRWVGAAVIATAMFVATRPTMRPREWMGAGAYWIHGYEHTGFGNLDLDWQSNTTSLEPVWDYVLVACQRVWPDVAHWLVFFLLSGLYIIALCRIATIAHEDPQQRARGFPWYAGIFALLLFAHWHRWWDTWVRHTAFPIPGVAHHYLLSPVLGPQMFGILLVVSITLFLKKREIPAVLTASLAAVVHPTYLFGAASLTIGYCLIVIVRRRDWKRALVLGAIALVIVTPSVIYAQRHLAATSPDMFHTAQTIITHFRIPTRALPAEWFDKYTVALIVIVSLAIFLERRTDLGILLAVMFGLGASVGLFQYLAETSVLATIMPWRVSVVLAPVSFAVILGRAWRFVYDRFGGWLERHPRVSTAAIAAIAMIPVYSGASVSWKTVHKSEASQDLFAYVAQHGKRGDVYVIPLISLGNFRLLTGMPIFIDAQAHPFRDVEVLEWYTRNLLVDRLYGDVGRDGERMQTDTEARAEPDCAVLTAVAACGVTHVIDVDKTIQTACAREPEYELHATYENKHYAVLEVHPTTALGTCALGAELERVQLPINGDHYKRRMRILGF